MITPTGRDDDFDFEQSSLRINIECAFGELVRRWGVLWRPLEMDFKKRAPVIGCCIRLHNFCVLQRLELDPELQQTAPLVGEHSGARVVDRDGLVVEGLCTGVRQPERDINQGADDSRRLELQSAVKDSGLTRPYRRAT